MSIWLNFQMNPSGIIQIMDANWIKKNNLEIITKKMTFFCHCDAASADLS